jgi:hypothetical protein
MSKHLRRMNKQVKKRKKKKTHSGEPVGQVRQPSKPKHPPRKKTRQREVVDRIHQRTSILGALKHDRTREPEDSVFQILAECLTRGAAASVTGDIVRRFFVNANVSSDDFFDWCLTDWRVHPEVGEYILGLLTVAGYEGHIDDLWLSVYGILKPSPKARAFGRRDPRASKIFPNRPWWVTHSRIIHTGQTRKPGSHGSK